MHRRVAETGIRVDCWSAHCQQVAEDITLSGDHVIFQTNHTKNLSIQVLKRNKEDLYCLSSTSASTFCDHQRQVI